MASTIPLSTTIGLTTRYIYNAPLLYVNSGALAYSLGDEVREFLLAPPFSWRWNRAELTPVVCQPGLTDYTVNIPDFGWLERAWVLYPQTQGTVAYLFNSLNIISITGNGTTAVATLNGNPLNFKFYIGQTISIQNVTNTGFNEYQNATITALSSNTISYANTTNATSSGGLVFNITPAKIPALNYNGSPLITKELEIVTSLAQESVLGQPAFISVINDDNNDNITFRLMMAPDQAYTLYIIYQKASPKFGATTDLWKPIPDYMSYVFNKGFLAKALEYRGDERFAYTWQEFLKMTVAANDGMTETEKNIFLESNIITAREKGVLQTSQQARSSRGGA